MKKYKVLAMFDEAEIDNKKTRAIIALVEDEVEEKVDKVLLELKSMNQKFDAKFDAMDRKLDAMDQKFDAKLDAMDSKFDAKFDALDTKINVLKYAAFALFLPVAYIIIRDFIVLINK